MNAKQRFLAACNGQPVDHPPVWIMRQAGRTLPEYNKVREQHSFWDICKTPELAALVTLQPVKRFPLDAAIIFSDILTIPAAMGQQVSFTPMSLTPAIRSAADVDNLPAVDIPGDLGYVGQAIEAVRAEVGQDFPVLGFSGAPYTLASYMVEGGSSKSYHRIKSLMYTRPEVYDRLLVKIADAVADYLLMQITASVNAVQLFDSWAGELSVPDYRRFALPYVQRIIQRLKTAGVPVIYFINGVGVLLETAAESGADVMGIDWRVSLTDARRRLGADRVVQGNLDPAVLFASKDEITRRTFAMLDETGGAGHIANLGHGVLPDTPLDGIAAFIDAVAQWSKRPV